MNIDNEKSWMLPDVMMYLIIHLRDDASTLTTDDLKLLVRFIFRNNLNVGRPTIETGVLLIMCSRINKEDPCTSSKLVRVLVQEGYDIHKTYIKNDCCPIMGLVNYIWNYTRGDPYFPLLLLKAGASMVSVLSPMADKRSCNNKCVQMVKKRIRQFYENLTEDSQKQQYDCYMKEITSISCNPHSLKSLSCFAVRKCLGKDVYSKVPLLEIPSHLHSELYLEELNDLKPTRCDHDRAC